MLRRAARIANAIYKVAFIAALAMALANVGAGCLITRVSTLTPTAENTASYESHGNVRYIPQTLSVWNHRLLMAFVCVFGLTVMCAGAWSILDRKAKKNSH